MRKIAMALAMGMIASTAFAESTSVAEYGWWELFKNSDRSTCHLIAIYDDEEALVIEYDAASKGAFVTFTHKHATSLKHGDKRKLDIAFVDGKSLDDGWTNIEFTTHRSNDDAPMLFSQKLNPQFLDDVAEGSTIGFYFGEKLLGSYNLKDTGRAIAGLKNCSLRAAGIDPRDPFAN